MTTTTDTMQLIKQLRQETYAPVTQCREALAVCHNDFSLAVEYLRKHVRRVKPAEERAGKITAYVHQNRIGVLVELRCATDFVANTDQFQNLCQELALQVASMGEENLLEQQYIRDASQTVKDLISMVSQQVGEPISIRRVTRWELA